MKRCNSCILPETYPGISFNEEGVCNFCSEYKPLQLTFGKEKLDTAINEVLDRSKPRAFDAVVPVSGGKDSAYVLYYTVKMLNLKTIAVTYNSGFQSKIAEANVANMCEKLAVPLVIVRPPGKTQLRVLRESYLLARKYGVMWWGTCDNCEPILRTAAISVARKHRTPIVMWGSSLIEASDITKYQESQTGQGSQSRKNSLLNLMGKIIGKLFTDPIKIISHGKLHLYSIMLRLSLGLPLRYALNPLSTPPLTNENPKFIPLFNYIQWDSIRNTGFLESELGWKHPPGRDSRFDCELHCVNNYNLLRQNGISSDGVSFNNFIREGKLTRQEGMNREAHIEAELETEYQELLVKLDFPGHKPL